MDIIILRGYFLQECSVEISVIGIRSRLEYGAELKETTIMGTNYYETKVEFVSLLVEWKIPMDPIKILWRLLYMNLI